MTHKLELTIAPLNLCLLCQVCSLWQTADISSAWSLKLQRIYAGYLLKQGNKYSL